MPIDNLTYAGVGMRLLASLIDYAIIAGIAMLPVMARYAAIGPEEAAWEHFAWVVALGWPYFSLMESSSWRGTPGKKLLGLRVADLKGGRIGPGRATVRYLCKLVLFLIWFVSIVTMATTPRKQALHDEIARTVVLRDA